LQRDAGRRDLSLAGDSAEDRTVTREMLRDAIGRLHRDEQDILYLIGGLGLTYEEAARALRLPIGTVRSRYSRARDGVASGLGAARPHSKRADLTRRNN
jgi:DNA-directed RNA polymerase specialized sigma24 family protein